MNNGHVFIAYELPFTRIPIPRDRLARLVRQARDYSIIVAKDWRTYEVITRIIETDKKSKIAVVMTRAKNWRTMFNLDEVEPVGP